jgi:hypothetical protein
VRTVPPAFHRYALVLLVTLAGVGCPPFKAITVITPARGDVVTSPSFDVTVEIDPTRVDPASLVVKLNRQTLTMSGGPTNFTVTVNPGPPLRDQNALQVRAARRTHGVAVRTVPFKYLPPKARARRITDPADLVTGPLAHGRVGDWLLENDQARYIVQDSNQRDLYSVGQFGGNLIDAELVVDGVRQGNDSFFEFQPLLNIETVLHASEPVELLNDGQDGTPAVIRVCGPDDLIDFINASSQVAELGFNLPAGTDDTDQNIWACNIFTLAPGDGHVTVETIVENLEAAGGDTYANYVGDYLNGMGQLESWTTADPFSSFTAQGVGELLTTWGYRALTYFGFRDATGVGYSYVTLPIPGAPTLVSSSFSTSGVTVSLQNTSIPVVLSGIDFPNLTLAPGETKSFSRLFAVGDGTPSNAVAMEAGAAARDVGTVQGCVTVGGVSAGAGARVAVGPESAGVFTALIDLFVTDASGCYSGELPVGSYGLAAGMEGVPYQGPAPLPFANPVTITSGGLTVQNVDLPATGRVRVNVTDENTAPVPARVTVVGPDPSPEPEVVFLPIGLDPGTAGLFRDVTKDSLRYGVVWMEYAGADGVAEFNLDPGTYQIYVSRGPEYSLYQAPITVGSGTFGDVTETVNAQIHQVVDTAGFVSGDYHVHLLASPDSRIGVDDRIRGYAGEGVDNLIATDHDALTKLGPRIDDLDLEDFLHSTIGEEITTFDYGHFNAYPQAQDTSVPSNGSTDFGGPALPGMDFPSLGSYSLSPAQLYAEAQGKLKSDGFTVQNAGLNTVVHVNHIDSHFGPLHINTALEPPASVLDPGAFDSEDRPEPNNPLFLRLDPTVTNFFHEFDGLELWNGASVGAQSSFLNSRIGVWMNHLNQGIAITAIGDTDTHTFFNLESAGARTWTPTSTGSQAPNALLDNDIGTSIADGKAVGGQGPYVQAKIVDTDTAAQADLTWAGSTLVSAPDGTVNLVVDVQAPTWAEYDTMEIYVNASTNVAGLNDGVPVAFGAIPMMTLTRDATDTATTFVVSTVAAAGDQRLETTKTIPLVLAGDAWVVVIVKGTVGNSPHMFPVFAYNLDSTENPSLETMTVNTTSEDGVRALGFTNALYVDVDGGGFDPPGVSCVDCP